MKRILLFSLFILIMISCKETIKVKITELTYKNTPHFKIETPSATYYLEKAAAGFSSIVDRDGKDWINFSKTENPAYPSSTASDYRGIPNMVFQGDDNGCGHPGFDKCVSAKISSNSIQSKSKSGLWQWTWTFENNLAYQTIEKVDKSRNYWFLYEGPIAGKFNPASQYWGNNVDGIRTDNPDYYKGQTVFGSWRWVYFGDNNTARVFVVAQKEEDGMTDCFGFLGNTKDGIVSGDGMVVFGFGREKSAKSLMNKVGNMFYIGFYESKIVTKTDHQRLSSYVNKILSLK